jgi:hypothetical protein
MRIELFKPEIKTHTTTLKYSFNGVVDFFNFKEWQSRVS